VKRLAFVIAATGILCAASLIALKFSDGRYAEIAKSFIASHLPFGASKVLLDSRPPVADRLADNGFLIGQPLLIRIFKQENAIEFWMQRASKFELALAYPLCAWSGALGPKLKEGDRQSPEGFYFASTRNLKPDSAYHRAINVGFPNAFDQSLGRTGSALMIHGSCVSVGCYAIRDAAVDDLFRIAVAALDAGQDRIPIHIFPFRMTEANLALHAQSPWIGFWRNLKEGDDLFQSIGLPPTVEACKGRYAFGSVGEGCTEVTSW
jgi:murein L,D-transpeptidase YafK